VYQALYRKWRPRSFDEVVGQPHITVTLKNELKSGRIAHAYLFTGSRGTGKTTCAKILAKAVNCLNPIDGNPCNTCVSCVGIDSGAILDVSEIDAASNNGVDNIRDLREEANFTPTSSFYRVYIIDEVHMLSAGAFNALLKTLEEPPKHVVFVLATTEVHKLPATILSRCQRFDFHRIPTEIIAQRLLYVCEKEGLNLTNDAAILIGRISDGGMRDALSLLDQCAATEGEITTDIVSRAAGLAGKDYLFDLTDAIAMHNSGAALEIIDKLHSDSCDMERLCEELIAHFRNLMVIKAVKNPDEIIRSTKEDIERFKSQAGNIPFEAVIHTLDRLQISLDRLRRASNRRVEMEMSLICLCSPELDDSSSALLRRIADIESKLALYKNTAPIAEKPHNENKEIDIYKPNPKIEKTVINEDLDSMGDDAPPLPNNAQTVRVDENIPFNGWPEVIATLARIDKPLAGVMTGSNAFIRGDMLLIDTQNSMFTSLIRQNMHLTAFNEAVKIQAGRTYRVGILKNSAQPKIQQDPLEAVLKRANEAGIEINKK
jgi:DNA polymerase-3 subunit gamma/tau